MLKYEDYLEQTPLLFKREVFENVAKKFPGLHEIEWKYMDFDSLYSEDMFNEYNLTLSLIEYILGDDVHIIEEECDFDDKKVVLDDEYYDIDSKTLEYAREDLLENGWTISNYDSIIEHMDEEKEDHDRELILSKISKLDIANLRRIELNYC